MVTPSQAASIRALDADETTRPFAALATRALVYADAEAAEAFSSAVLSITVRIREAWGVGRDGASQSEALLLANMLFLLRVIALRFPTLSAIVPPAPPAMAAEAPAAGTKRPAPKKRRRRKGANNAR